MNKSVDLLQLFNLLYSGYENQDVYVEFRFVKNGNEGSLTEPPIEDYKRIKFNRFLIPISLLLNPEDFEKIYTWILENNKNRYHVFYSPIPKDSEGNSLTDKIKVIFVDIDYYKEFEYHTEIKNNVWIPLTNELDKILGKEFYSIIDSGGGWHLYFILDEFIDFDIYEKITKGFIEFLKNKNINVDEKPSLKRNDLILRLPYTTNWKYTEKYDDEKAKAEILQLQENLTPLEKIKIFENKAIEDKEKIQNEETQYKDLSNEELNQLFEILKPFYKEGYRQNLTIYLAGLFKKSGISKESVKRLIKKLIVFQGDNEENQRFAGIEHTYKKEIEQIKGKLGIEEVLKSQGVEEESIANIIYSIQEIIKPSKPFDVSYFYVLIDEEKKEGFINAPRGIYRFRIFKENNGKDRFKYGKKIFDLYLEEVYKIVNDAYRRHGLEYYEVVYKKPDGNKEKVKGTIDQILEKLKNYSVNHRTYKECFIALVRHMERLGVVKHKKTIEVEGIYIDENKELICSIPKPKNFDLKESAKALKEFIEKFNTDAKRIFILKWILLSPYNFVIKFLKENSEFNIHGIYREPYKFLLLKGASRTGKSTFAEFIKEIWNLNNAVDISGNTFKSEFRAGRSLNNHTFPVVINEFKLEPERVKSHADIEDLIKNSYDQIVIREAGDKIYLGLSPIMITSNDDIELPEGLKQRFDVIDFGIRDKITDEAKKEFGIWKREKFKYIRGIGIECFEIIKENPEILSISDINEAGKILLEKFFKKAGIEPPKEIYLSYYPDEKDDYEQLRENIIHEIKDYIETEYEKIGEKVDISKTSYIDMLKELQNRKGTLLIVYDEDKDTLILREGFKKLLARKGIKIANLQMVAEIFEGEYRKLCKRSLGLNGSKVAIIPINRIFEIEEEKPSINVNEETKREIYQVSNFINSPFLHANWQKIEPDKENQEVEDGHKIAIQMLERLKSKVNENEDLKKEIDEVINYLQKLEFERAQRRIKEIYEIAQNNDSLEEEIPF